MFKVIGKRLTAYAPIVLEKDVDGIGKAGLVLDDGKPKETSLGKWSDKKVAEAYADGIRSHVSKKVWKIWVE